MNIQLNPKHRLTSDKHNYIIEVLSIPKKGKDKGKEMWSAQAFYPKLSQALQGYSERFLREGEANSLRELNTSIRALYGLCASVKEQVNG